MKEFKKYWLWEKGELDYPLKEFKELDFDDNEFLFHRYNFQLSYCEEISEDSTFLFKMLNRITKDIFFVTGSLFCNLEIKNSFKSKLTSYKDNTTKSIESDEITFEGSDFKFQDLKGYIDHHYYFDNYKILPLTEPNEQYFDDNGFVDTENYGFLEIYKIDELDKLITKYILTK